MSVVYLFRAGDTHLSLPADMPTRSRDMIEQCPAYQYTHPLSHLRTHALVGSSTHHARRATSVSVTPVLRPQRWLMLHNNMQSGVAAVPTPPHTPTPCPLAIRRVLAFSLVHALHSCPHHTVCTECAEWGADAPGKEVSVMSVSLRWKPLIRSIEWYHRHESHLSGVRERCPQVVSLSG
jgi:hypothetical protein